jgi:hypothetical protein
MRSDIREDGRRRDELGGRVAQSSLAMIAACFRHQHPEAFGREPVPGVVLPINLRYGRDEIWQSPPTEALPEECLNRRVAPLSADGAVLATEP